MCAALCHKSGRDVEPVTGDCELSCAMLGILRRGPAKALLHWAGHWDNLALSPAICMFAFSQVFFDFGSSHKHQKNASDR